MVSAVTDETGCYAILNKEEYVVAAKDYSKCCDYCLTYLVAGTSHCQKACHETFANQELLSEHLHKTTRGCRWPGNIEDFYRKEGVWHKKEKKPEEEQEDTPAQSRNSNSSRGAAKRSTSNGSRDRRSQDDRQPGRSW